MSSSVIPATTPVSWTKVPDGTAALPSFSFSNSQGTGIYRVSADVLGLSTAGVQRVVVDASGNVGVGTASPSPTAGKCVQVQSNVQSELILDNTPKTGGIKWVLASGSLGTVNNGFLAFYDATTAAERMRIDASGNLLVGTTSQSGRLTVKGSTNNGSSNVFTFVDSADAVVTQMSTGGDFYLPKMGSSTGTSVVLTAGGYLVKSSSSIRYKKDVEPIDIGLDFICGLNPVKYNLKVDNTAQVGFIAEDFPDARLVSFSQVDALDSAKGLQREGVLYSQIVAPLVKAIQELSAKVDAQAAEIEALKAK